MDNKKHYYKYFDLADVPKQFKDRQEVYNLFKKPKNEKHQESPHFYNFCGAYIRIIPPNGVLLLPRGGG